MTNPKSPVTSSSSTGVCGIVASTLHGITLCFTLKARGTVFMWGFELTYVHSQNYIVFQTCVKISIFHIHTAVPLEAHCAIMI